MNKVHQVVAREKKLLQRAKHKLKFPSLLPFNLWISDSIFSNSLGKLVHSEKFKLFLIYYDYRKGRLEGLEALLKIRYLDEYNIDCFINTQLSNSQSNSLVYCLGLLPCGGLLAEDLEWLQEKVKRIK